MGAETPVLCFERTGGYAGIHQSFLIYSDGRVFDVGGRLRTIPPGVARAFRLRFDTIGPSRSGRLGTRKGLCMDCFQYRISVWGMSGVKTFVLEEPFLETADSLARLARELRELLAGLRWK